MGHHFFIHTGNRTESLFEGVATLIEADASPFQNVVFLVQGRGMERWLQQRLSQRFGVWLGGKFPFPQTFFNQLAMQLDTSLRNEDLQREHLRWRIEALLRTESFSEDPLLSPMLAGEGKDKRCFLLAEQLANLFDQYQIFRPDWLAAWSRGECVTDNPHEHWQMRLWQALDLKVHRGQLWRQLIDLLNTQSSLSGLPDQVFAFGISFLPPLMLEALQALSRHVPVHLFTLSPTEGFWADLPSRRQQLKTLFLEAETGLTDLEVGFHPLLLALGRQGAHFQHLMLEAEGRVYGRLEYFQPSETSTLLGQLQRDLLENRPVEAIEKAEGLESNILFHRCHTPQREVEVLRDRILTLLEADPDLSPNDIVVMAPDLTPYRPFIASLFAELPHTIADRSVEADAPALKLLNDWLALLQGRLDWDEVFDFLHQPEVKARLGLSSQQLERLYEVLVEQGQIRWGLAGNQHRNHWMDGLQRVLLGAVMHAPDALWQDYAPVTTLEGSSIHELTPVLALFDQIETWSRLRQQSLSAEDWAAHINKLAEFFYGQDAPERLSLTEATEALKTETEALGDAPISLETLASWAQSLGAERRSSAGFLSNGITFCDLLPMRSIPIKVAFLLGMDDRSYPRPRPVPDFDLMRSQFRIGDRDLSAEDRYTFLELLLSVRGRLEILWQGLSADKNTLQPPAQVVLELMDTLTQHYGMDMDTLTLSHKAFPFHSDYFIQGCQLQGRWPQDFEICQALHKTDKTLSPLWQQPIAWPNKTLSLHTLSLALSDPVGWALAQYDTRLEEIKTLPEPREKLDVNGLDRWQLRDAIKGEDPAEKAEHILPRWQAEGRWPLLATSEKAVGDSVDLVTRVWNKLETHSYNLGEPLEAEVLSLQIGQWTLTHPFQNRYEHGQKLFYPHRLKGHHALHYWLSHLLLNALQAQQTTWVGHLEGKEKSSKPVAWCFAPLSAEVAIDQLAQWLTLFEQVLHSPPLWQAEWMMKWLKNRKGEDWFEAATLASGLRSPGFNESGPDDTWLLYVRHLDDASLRQKLEEAYQSLQPVLTFWQAHLEHFQ